MVLTSLWSANNAPNLCGQPIDEIPSEPPLLRFEETETGLRVFDQATGDELGFVDGAGLTHIARIAQTDELWGLRVFVIEDGQVTPAEVPWPDGVL